jgi:hypothetical protein
VPGLPSGSTATRHYGNRSTAGQLHTKARAGIATFLLTRPSKSWVTAWATTPVTAGLAASHSRRYAVRIG